MNNGRLQYFGMVHVIIGSKSSEHDTWPVQFTCKSDNWMSAAPTITYFAHVKVIIGGK